MPKKSLKFKNHWEAGWMFPFTLMFIQLPAYSFSSSTISFQFCLFSNITKLCIIRLKHHLILILSNQPNTIKSNNHKPVFENPSTLGLFCNSNKNWLIILENRNISVHHYIIKATNPVWVCLDLIIKIKVHHLH